LRIFIDIGHPAHVHYIRPFFNLMREKGHVFFISARQKECSHELLDYYEIPYYNRGKGGKGFLSKLLYLFITDIKLWKQAIRFKPDVFIGFSSPYLAHVSFLYHKPYIVCDDTEKNKLTQLFYRPFAKIIITPDCYQRKIGKKQIKVPSYFELFYLHRNYFKPDISVLKSLNIQENEKYVILRFVSFHASHDIGQKGIHLSNKLKAVKELSKYARVFISSESELPKELEAYRIPIKAWQIHDAIYYSSLLFGESATMASEAACLGTPAIYINNDGRGYTIDEEKKYGLVFNYSEALRDQNIAIEKAIEIIKYSASKGKAQAQREILLKEKTNITEILVKTIEEYISS